MSGAEVKQAAEFQLKFKAKEMKCDIGYKFQKGQSRFVSLIVRCMLRVEGVCVTHVWFFLFRCMSVAMVLTDKCVCVCIDV